MSISQPPFTLLIIPVIVIIHLFYRNFGESNCSLSIMENSESQDTWSEIYLTKYKLYSRDIKRLLIGCGISPNLNPILQYAITSLAIVSLSLAFVGSLNFSLHHLTDMMVFTKNIGVVISLLGVILKICIFVSYRNDLTNLNNQLSARFVCDLDNPDYQPHALYYYQSFANLFYSLTTTVGVTCFIKVLSPLLAIMHGNYETTIPVIYPFRFEPGSFLYWLIQASDGYGIYLVWSVTCSVDSIFGLYTMQMCGGFRVLAYKFERLSTSINYQKDIEDCIRRHHVLMKSMSTLEKIFSILVFWLAGTSAIIQCTFMFQMTVLLKTKNIPELMYTFAYIILKLLQAFMYAWYGNLITDESQSCLDAMYNAAWAGSGDKQLMSDVLIVLSQRPLVFIAIGWLRVKMEMFLTIFHTAVSYFFLLQTLESSTD